MTEPLNADATATSADLIGTSAAGAAAMLPGAAGCSSDEIIPGADTAQLGRLVRGGAFWSLIQVALRNLVSVGTTAVLARLVSPHDFGILGMVATLTAFLQVFSDLGLSSATIQRPDLTKGQFDNLFWVNACFGLALWLLAMVTSPLAAWFYNSPELTGVVIVCGAGFLINGLAVQPMAVLRRQMNFRLVTYCELAGSIGGAAAGIALAVNGYGFWALAWQAVAGSLTRAVTLLVFAGYWPGPFRSGRETGALLAFGGWTSVCTLAVYCYRNLDCVLLGRYWGAEELGFYGRAYFLASAPMTIAGAVISPLLVPALSAIQNDRPRFNNGYVRAVHMLSMITMPVFVGMFVIAPELIRLIYGATWLSVVPILRCMALGAAVLPLTMPLGAIFVALNRMQRLVWWTLFSAVVICLCYVCAVPYGPQGMGVAFAASFAGLALPAAWYTARAADMPLWPILAAFAKPALAAALMGAGVWATRCVPGLGSISALAGVGVYVAVGVVLYLPLLLIVDAGVRSNLHKWRSSIC